MNKLISISTFVMITALVVSSSFAQDKEEVVTGLQAMDYFIGTWEGEFTNSTSDMPMSDVVSFEYILNGKAIRSVHEVTGGYGGETIYYLNPADKTIRLWYFTNVGQYSEGTCLVEGRDFHFKADHFGGETTAWTSVSRILDQNSFQVTSQYQNGDTMVEGHAIIYHRKEQ